MVVKKLFAQKRKNHEEAIQTLLKVDKYERLYKMVSVLTEAMVEVIESSRNVIENASFVPSKSLFPEDATVRDGIYNYLLIIFIYLFINQYFYKISLYQFF